VNLGDEPNFTRESTMNDHFPRDTRRGGARLLFPALAACGALALTACASTPPPTEQVAVSTAAVANAVGAGATELAPAEMKAARDKLDRAKLAMVAKDYGSALALAQEAQVDAGVAQAKAQSVKARKAAETVREDSRALREEMDRKKTDTATPAAKN
jgi:Domain of unknown function (DUF4398)